VIPLLSCPGGAGQSRVCLPRCSWRSDQPPGLILHCSALFPRVRRRGLRWKMGIMGHGRKIPVFSFKERRKQLILAPPDHCRESESWLSTSSCQHGNRRQACSSGSSAWAGERKQAL